MMVIMVDHRNHRLKHVYFMNNGKKIMLNT